MQDTQPPWPTALGVHRRCMVFGRRRRAIIFRETLFRAMSRGRRCQHAAVGDQSCRARLDAHRPQDPEGTPGRRPHHQCGAVAPGSAFRRRPACAGVRALEEAGYIKGYRGLLDEKILAATRSPCSPWCIWRARRKPTLPPSRTSCARRIWCANAGCCRARSTSLEVRRAGLEDLPGLRAKSSTAAPNVRNVKTSLVADATPRTRRWCRCDAAGCVRRCRYFTVTVECTPSASNVTVADTSSALVSAPLVKSTRLELRTLFCAFQ